ncbi:MAG: CHASE2 domain-containing protein, partial [Deltaproteobacteria bacterium]|nr:CHASE2 domain-containing protein [Deltaproteobacteria bacterium]
MLLYRKIFTLKRRWRSLRAARKYFILALALAFVQVFIFAGEAGFSPDVRLMNVWFQLRGRKAYPKDKMALIAIDDQSFSKLNLSVLKPWPREATAKLLEKLSNYDVKAVFLDYRYGEPNDPEGDRKL